MAAYLALRRVKYFQSCFSAFSNCAQLNLTSETPRSSLSEVDLYVRKGENYDLGSGNHFALRVSNLTAEAGQDENNGSQCKTNRLRAHQVVSSAHCIALQLHKRKQKFERPQLGIRMHPHADGYIRVKIHVLLLSDCIFFIFLV